MNEVVPPQPPQNPQVPIEERVMSYFEMRDAIHSLTQVLVTQVAMNSLTQVNPNTNTMYSRIWDFTGINSPYFLWFLSGGGPARVH